MIQPVGGPPPIPPPTPSGMNKDQALVLKVMKQLKHGTPPNEAQVFELDQIQKYNPKADFYIAAALGQIRIGNFPAATQCLNIAYHALA